MVKKEIIGVLSLFLLVAGIVYISFNGAVQIRIDNDKAVFYVNESRWVISAVQEDRLFAGTNIVNRVKSSIVRGNYEYEGLHVEYRNTDYSNGEKIIHTWKFDPTIKNVEDFPIKEEICIVNADGKYYRYSLKQLYEPGPKRKLVTETSASFGRNMKVTFEPDYSWAWVGWPYGEESFAVQYKIDSDYECFDIRVFDPEPAGVFYSPVNPSFEIGSPFNWTGTGGIGDRQVIQAHTGTAGARILQTGGVRTLLYQKLHNVSDVLINNTNYTASAWLYILSGQDVGAGYSEKGLLSMGSGIGSAAARETYGIRQTLNTTDTWMQINLTFTYNNATDLFFCLYANGSNASGGGYVYWDDAYIFPYTAANVTTPNATNTTNTTLPNNGTIWLYSVSNYSNSLWMIDFGLNNKSGATSYNNNTCGNYPSAPSVNISAYKVGSYALSYLSERSSMGTQERQRFSINNFPRRFFNNTYRIFFQFNQTLSATSSIGVNINVSRIANRTGINALVINSTTYRAYRINRNGGIYNDTSACFEQPIRVG